MLELSPTTLRRKRLDAKRRYRDTARIHRSSVITVRRLLAKTVAAALRMYRAGNDPVDMVVESLQGLRGPLTQCMVAAHLVAFRRAKLQMRRPSLKLSAVSDALQFFQRKTTMTDSQLRVLKDTCANQAIAPLSVFTAGAERKLNKAMLDITQQNLHVSKGAAELSKAFENAGVSPRSSFQAEAVFRTQTQLAYSEEHWNSNDDPFIQDELWGYIYMTVGDDRVRDEHAGLDETTAPKDDPVWNSIWPPNGWACRCIPVEVWNDEVDLENPPTKMPSELKQVNEKLVVPGPDAGWNFHPGKLGPRWQGGTPAKVKPPIQPTPTTVQELPERMVSQSEWEKGLTATEKASIDWWGETGYKSLRHLYKIEAGLEKMPADKLLGIFKDIKVSAVQAQRAHFMAALQRSPKYRGNVYRGLVVDNPEKMFKKGGIFTDVAPASATKSLEVGKEFAGGVELGNRRVILHMTQESGSDISKLSGIAYQEEVLIHPGTKFRIKRIGGGREFVHVYLDEIVEEVKTIPKVKPPPVTKPKMPGVTERGTLSQAEWEKSMTANERDAIGWWWGGGGAPNIRRLHRIEAGLERMPSKGVFDVYKDIRLKGVQLQRSDMMAFLGRSPKYEGKLYRGMIIDNPEKMFKKGGIYVDVAPASASKSWEVGKHFARESEPMGHKRVLLHMTQKSGSDISKISGIAYQEEVIVHPGTRFRITSTKRAGGFFNVYVDEIVEEVKTIPKIKPPKPPIPKPKPVKPVPTATHTEWTVTTDKAAAQEAIKDRLGVRGGIVTKGYSSRVVEMRHLNEVGQHVTELRSRFPKLAAILDKKKAVGHIKLHDAKLVPGSKAYGHFKTTTKRIEMAMSAKGQMTSPGVTFGEHITGRGVLDILRHEIGHALEWPARIGVRRWEDMWRLHPKQAWSRIVSRIGAGGERELWAECFSAYTHPMYGRVGGRLPAQIEAFIEKIIGRHPNLGAG